MSAMLAEFPPMVIGGSIISAVSLIVHVIGFSTTYWYRVGVAHMGLWKSCGEVKGAELCFDIKDAPVHYNQLVAAQVLECLALVAFVAAVTCAFLKMFVLKEQGMLFVVTGLLNWLAGGLALVGVIVFATMQFGGNKLDNSKFSLYLLAMYCGWNRRSFVWHCILRSMAMGEKLTKTAE